MKKLNLILIAFIIGLFLGVGNINATLIGGPAPLPGFGNDDGTERWIPNDVVLSVQLYDLPDLLPGLLFSGFGFYFTEGVAAPTFADLIPIFDIVDDQDPLSTQVALVDFGAGEVIDVDEGAIQSTFTDLGTSIGFFFAFDQAPGPPVSPMILLTESQFNFGGIDAAATFPLLADPEVYLLAFEWDFGGLTPTPLPIAVELIAGVTRVPEPATFFLLGAGLLGLVGGFRRKFKS